MKGSVTMARKPIVSRTIKTTNVHCLFYNIETGSTFEGDIVLPRTYKTEKDILKYIEKNTPLQENVRLVHVKAWDVEQKLRSMTEEDFIKYSTVVE